MKASPSQPPISALGLLIGGDCPTREQEPSVASYLRQVGYKKLLFADTSDAALGILEGHTPDFILISSTFTGNKAARLCRTLRQNPDHVCTPIVYFTTQCDEDDRAMLFNAGLTDLIQLPVFPKELEARLRLHQGMAKSIQDLQEYRTHVDAEIEQARQMQQLLLPTKPILEEIEASKGIIVNSFFQPSFALSGDSWDIFSLSPTHLAFFICDFTGHGVGAAINSFRLHTLLTHCRDHYGNPGRLLDYLNNKLKIMLHTGIFATCFYGIIDTENDTLSYATSGAPNPLIYRHKENRCIEIDASGVPLGVVKDHRYATHAIPFLQGDTLCLYGDALVDSVKTQPKEAVTEADIHAQLQLNMQSPTGASQRRFLHHMLKKLGVLDGRPNSDDLTMVLFTRKP